MIEMLRYARAHHFYSEKSTLSNVCTKRYPAFMRALKDDNSLVPPLDVAIVMFHHMLQSKEYFEFAKTFGVHHVAHFAAQKGKSFKELLEGGAKAEQLIVKETGVKMSYGPTSPSSSSTSTTLHKNPICGVEAKV